MEEKMTLGDAKKLIFAYACCGTGGIRNVWI